MASEVDVTTATMKSSRPREILLHSSGCLVIPSVVPLFPVWQLLWQLLKLGLVLKEIEHSSKLRVISYLMGSTEILSEVCLIHMLFD